MRILQYFMLAYFLTFAPVYLTGCAAADFLLGKSKESVVEEVDANKDGVLSEQEVKASPYDRDKDGELSVDEMIAAMAPHQSTDMLFEVMALLNVPFAGVGALALKKAREHRSAFESVVGGVEDLVHAGRDGFTKEDLYLALETSAKQRGNVDKIAGAVKQVKNEIRKSKSHIPIASPAS